MMSINFRAFVAYFELAQMQVHERMQTYVPMCVCDMNRFVTTHFGFGLGSPVVGQLARSIADRFIQMCPCRRHQ